MDETTLSVRVLAVAPRPLGVRPVPGLSAAESFCGAVEAQGDAVELEWLRRGRWGALEARLTDKASPPDALYLDVSVSTLDGGVSFLLEGYPPDAHAVPGETLIAALASAPVRMLMVAAHGAREAREALDQWCRDQTDVDVLCIDPTVKPDALQALLSGVWASWVAGATWSEAVTSAGEPSTTPRFAYVEASERPALAYYGQDKWLADVRSAEGGVPRIVRFPSPDLAPSWGRLPAEPMRGGLPLEPPHGFVGRGSEVALVMGALADHSRPGAVWLAGHVGTGKTALAAHLARWCVRTGAFHDVVYVPFRGGGTAESATADMCVRLLGQGAHTREDLLAALEQSSTLAIWDDLHAVLGGDMTLDDDDQKDLLELGDSIARSGASRLLAIGDGLEVPSRVYASLSMAATFTVEGLDPGDALSLWGDLWRGALPPRHRAEELVHALGERPLAIEVSARQRRTDDLDVLFHDLKELLPGLEHGGARTGNQAVELLLQYALGSLNADRRASALRLGGLSIGGIEPLLRQGLGLDEVEWTGIRDWLVAHHLVEALPVEGLAVPFMSVSPALLLFASRRLTEAQRAATAASLYVSTLGFASWFRGVDASARPVAAAMARLELPKLRRVHRQLLSSDRLEEAYDYARHLCYVLDRLGLDMERDAVQARTEQHVKDAVSAPGPLERHVTRFVIGQAQRLIESRHPVEAANMLQGLLKRMDEEPGMAYEGDAANLDKAMALRRLGMAMQGTGRIDVAAGAYAQAMALLRSLAASDVVRDEILAIYEPMISVSMGLGQADAAEKLATEGIAYAEGLGEQSALAALTAQLGGVLAAKGDVQAALVRLHAALDLYGEKEYLPSASVWLQIGSLEAGRGEMEAAEDALRQALDMASDGELPPIQAEALMRLGKLAEADGRLAKARERYSEALHHYTQHNQAPQVVTVQLALADVALREGDLSGARVYAQAARALADKMVPGGVAWQPLLTLERIAQAAGESDQAADYRRRTQEAFAQAPEAQGVRQQWRQLIEAVVASSRGEALDADAVSAIERLETDESWASLAGAIWGILAGERGDELFAELDHVDAVVVRAILDGIAAPESEAQDDE